MVLRKVHSQLWWWLGVMYCKCFDLHGFSQISSHLQKFHPEKKLDQMGNESVVTSQTAKNDDLQKFNPMKVKGYMVLE